MLRPILIAALVAAFTVPAHADPSMTELERAFAAEPAISRKTLQDGLRSDGLYTGPRDGLWGPGMIAAFERLMATPVYRRANLGSGSEASVDTLRFIFSLDWLEAQGYQVYRDTSSCDTCD